MAELRHCIGSARYGIEPHEVAVEDFPAQPSQKDGLGRMCRLHWNAYTKGLARDAKARKAVVPEAESPVLAEPATPEPTLRASRRRARQDAADAGTVEEVATAG